MDIQFNYEYRENDLRGYPLEALARFVLAREKCPEQTEVSVSFVDNARIAELNEAYRGIEGPTDVLSFECDGAPSPDDEYDEAIVLNSPVFELGDIVIAPDIAEQQCAGFGSTLEEELKLLLTHGLLHLCGYDHLVDEEAEVMEARERELLAAWEAQA